MQKIYWKLSGLNMVSQVKILVVDDDPSLLDLLIETLSTIGYKTVDAENAADALEKLEKN